MAENELMFAREQTKFAEQQLTQYKTAGGVKIKQAGVEFKEMAAGIFGGGSKGQVLEKELAEAQARANAAADRKREMKQLLEETKPQVKVQANLAAAAAEENVDKIKAALPKIRDAAKKAFGPYGLIGGGLASGMRTLKAKAAPAIATAKDSLGAIGKSIVDRGAVSPYRANMAAMGGTAADYSGREFTSAFLQENRKEKDENWDEKQYNQLETIAEVVKKNLRPYGGIQDLFEIVRG
jgi:hypothetical protein